MALTDTLDSGRSGARSIMVWDPLVRLIHWGLALAILLNGAVVDEDGALHEWIGYAAVGLVGLRLVWGVFGPPHARMSAFPPNPVAALSYVATMFRGDKTVHLSHNPLGGLMVYNIWLTVLALGATGYMMGTPRFFGVEWVEEVHEFAFGWLVASIALHLAGVAFDTWRTGVPLVRAMIDGKKRIPKDRPIE